MFAPALSAGVSAPSSVNDCNEFLPRALRECGGADISY